MAFISIINATTQEGHLGAPILYSTCKKKKMNYRGTHALQERPGVHLENRLTLVVKHTHGTVTLVVGHAGPEGTVDWELQVVGSQPVSMCVWVGEETSLHKDMRGDGTWGSLSAQTRERQELHDAVTCEGKPVSFTPLVSVQGKCVK